MLYGIQELTRAENKTDLSINVTAEAENKQCTDWENIQYFCREKEERKIAVSRIIISGNTTMIHLLMGQVKIQNQRAVIKTIKNIMPPNGICGTGLVSAIAQLKQNKLMNKQGELRYPYNEKGYPLWTLESGEKIALYQQDVREFQMAKSAVRAGIESLMQEYGCIAKDIRRVYLAGGFGVNLSEEDAICTGILPEEFRGRIEPIGNGALQGTIQVGRGKTVTFHTHASCA